MGFFILVIWYFLPQVTTSLFGDSKVIVDVVLSAAHLVPTAIKFSPDYPNLDEVGIEQKMNNYSKLLFKHTLMNILCMLKEILHMIDTISFSVCTCNIVMFIPATSLCILSAVFGNVRCDSLFM